MFSVGISGTESVNAFMGKKKKKRLCVGLFHMCNKKKKKMGIMSSCSLFFLEIVAVVEQHKQ